MPEEAIDLTVIVVNWNVRELLRACLASLSASPGVCWEVEAGGTSAPPPSCLRAETIVVDNASQDGSEAMVAGEYPWVKLIANRTNRGFTGGNNQGLAASRGRYVLFLNPDTEVVGDALRQMVLFMDAHPQVGALGPELRYADGSPQPSRRRFPTLLMALFESTPLAWHWPRNPWASRYRFEGEAAHAVQVVDWVVGAALMARRTALDQVGGFDEGYFMYSEELDWCRRAASAGWQTVYLPSAQIVHHEGKSSEQVVAARHIRFQTSKVRYFRKFHGQLAAETLRCFLLAAYTAEWLLEAGKWLARSKPPLRRARMAAYRQLLRTRLRSRPLATISQTE